MNVPHNFPNSVPTDRNALMRYHKTSPNTKRVRVGIIERHTYKTDSGELLPGVIYKNANRIRVRSNNDLFGNQKMSSVRSPEFDMDKTEMIDSFREQIKQKLIHSTNTVQTEHCDSTTDLEVPSTSPMQSSQRIINVNPSITPEVLGIFDTPHKENDCFDSQTVQEQVNNDHSLYTLPPQKHYNGDEDSDSDCQIIEVSNAKQGMYVRNGNNGDDDVQKIFRTNSVNKETIHVISDSDSDSDTLPVKRVRSLKQYKNLSKNKENDNKNIFQLNRNISVSQLNSNFVIKSLKHIDLNEVDSSLTDLQEQGESASENESSVYEIFNGIKITLPSAHGSSINKSTMSTDTEVNRCVVNNNSIIISKKKLFDEYLLKDATKSELIGLLSKPSTSYLRSLSQRPDTTTKSIEKVSPKSEVSTKDLTPTKSTHKPDYQLSPESMKSEFYSYLKINTNPLAQKEEAVAQNRRSNRVKNLISQNEKLKEKIQKSDIVKKSDGEESHKKKLNDVRSKYLKYSKKQVVFPQPTIECKRIENFKYTVENYFLEEKINFLKVEKSNSYKVMKNNGQKHSDAGQRSKVFEHRPAMLYRTKILQQMNDKIDTIKTRDKILKVKKKNLIKKKLKYKNLRLSTNRVLRNACRPVTRHAIKDHIIFKKQQIKLNIKSKHAKTKCLTKLDMTKEPKVILSRNEIEEIVREKKNISNSEKLKNVLNKNIAQGKSETEKIKLLDNIVDSEKILSNEETKKNLSPLDKFEIITQTYLAEHPLEHQYFTDELSSSPSPAVDKHSSINSVNNVTNGEKQKDLESNRKSNHSPHCIGFIPDNAIVKIRENFQNILKTQFENSDNNSVTETSESDDQIFNSHKNDEDDEDSSVAPSNIDNSTLNSKQQNSKFLIDEAENEKTHQEGEKLTELFKSNMQSLKNPNYIPLNPNVKMKSFHRSLLTANSKRKMYDSPSKTTISFPSNSSFNFEYIDTESFSSKMAKTPNKKQTHEIDIDKSNGPVFNAYYVNCTLIVVQEKLISFWKQTPLGNILGAQNMWLSIGNIQRITLERGCINRRSSEMIFNLENSVAYVELWTKEHKSAFRERPIADVFATIYYHKGQGVPDKKVLQLENIKGFGNDVRFAVIKNSREIIVSWCDTFSKPIKTLVRSYELAADFQTVSSIKEMESVSYYVSSLHNIGDCDTLVLGASNEQVFVWNLAHGWLVSTVSLTETNMQTSSPSHAICLWAHCDNGFLFLLQQIGIGILRLVAVNGMTNEWKQLQTYRVPDCYLNLLGVTVESGILMTCYTNGFLCWDMQSGQLLADTDTPSDQIVLPSNKYLVSIDNFQVTVKHVMAYLLTND